MLSVEEATALGKEHGHDKATWVFDGNTSENAYGRFLQGHEDGDPEIMDMCPAPLSGEWAGESMWEILGAPEDGDDLEADDAWQEVADAYENAFTSAWWTETLRVANYHVEVAAAEVASG